MTWLALVLIGFVASVPARQLQPKTYASPSGGWSLRVEPSTRDGTGEAEYTLTGGGREAWKRRHPFALSDAAVTDDGRVGGYAYVGNSREMHAGGSLHVVVLSPKGDVALDEAHERLWGLEHAPGNPYALGMFVQPELARLVIRVGEKGIGLEESWWGYDLVTGKPSFQERAAREPNTLRYATSVQVVPKTPLVLVHWMSSDYQTTPTTHGAIFELLDPERRPVWRLDLPHDYEVPGDVDGAIELRDVIRARGAILATEQRSFELRHVHDEQRVRYSVAPDGAGAWTVSEIGREPFVEEPGRGALASFTPKLLRTVALGAAAPPPAEIRDVLAFGFDDESRLRFVRGEERGATLVQLDATGAVSRAVRAPEEIRPAIDAPVQWFPLADHHWLAAAQAADRTSHATVWRVDEETGSSETLPDFPGQSVERIVPLPGERLLVLSTWYAPYSMITKMSACDRDGRVLWQLDPSHEESPFGSAGDCTVTRDGKVVVLDSLQNALHVFSSDGGFLSTIDLAEAWGEEPGYPDALVPDVDGGVLVKDTLGWRMALDGAVRGKLDPGAAGKPTLAGGLYFLQVAPDGHLWTTDRHEFVRLDEQGLVDLTLGTPARLDWLEAPDFAAVDSTFGRVLVHDERTNEVHVFDADGHFLTACHPRAEDQAQVQHPSRIGSDSSGGTITAQHRSENHYVRFDADGRSLGSVKLVGINATFVPGRDAYWSVVDTRAVLTGSYGKPQRELAKLGDGRWWREISDLSVARDGTLAVLDLPTWSLRRETDAGLVARFDVEGREIDDHPLPAGVFPYQLAHDGHWILLSSYGLPAWLLDARDGSIRSIALGEEKDPKLARTLGLAPSGEELWVVEIKALRLLRYALPD